MKKRVAIFISGRGSNMLSLIEAAKDPLYPASIELVFSNDIDAPGSAYPPGQVPVEEQADIARTAISPNVKNKDFIF